MVTTTATAMDNDMQWAMTAVFSKTTVSEFSHTWGQVQQQITMASKFSLT